MNRLDKELVSRRLVTTRSQAENYIKLGMVKINGVIVKKPATMVSSEAKVALVGDSYVSRAALKLASVSDRFDLQFKGKTVMDVGSSTGGFTDFALQHGAKRVIAVDVGTEQLHPVLRGNKRVELHEKTDIRDFKGPKVDMIVADVSFISLTKILPSLKKFCHPKTELIMMCKPQFEAGRDQTNKGIIKNSKIRREILSNFEHWLKTNGFAVVNKADSQVTGTKGNVERFYKMKVSL